VVVSNSRDLATLQSWRVARPALIRPGIDLSRFRVLPRRDPDGTFCVLAGSAPWTVRQFRSKGVEALLDAAVRLPSLSLVFLWRGLLLDEMRRRVARRGLQERVQIVAERVDVSALLAQVDAAVVLSAHPTLVKAFPHSLLEALAAGKPVLVSRTIPMADYVEETGCGLVVDGIGTGDVVAALERLRDDYDPLQGRAAAGGGLDFAQSATVEAYQSVYAGAVANKDRPGQTR
jgi:glycosyltransferase involved in cell wall biosynthesis